VLNPFPVNSVDVMGMEDGDKNCFTCSSSLGLGGSSADNDQRYFFFFFFCSRCFRYIPPLVAVTILTKAFKSINESIHHRYQHASISSQSGNSVDFLLRLQSSFPVAAVVLGCVFD
jgi:hypothetical protein